MPARLRYQFDIKRHEGKLGAVTPEHTRRGRNAKKDQGQGAHHQRAPRPPVVGAMGLGRIMVGQGALSRFYASQEMGSHEAEPAGEDEGSSDLGPAEMKFPLQ